MLKSSFWATAKGTVQGVPKKCTSPTALNFGYDFVLVVHFLGHPVLAAVNDDLNSDKDDSDDDRCPDDVSYCE